MIESAENLAAAKSDVSFQIFRRAEAQGLAESGHMATADLDATMAARLSSLVKASGGDGAETRFLFGGGGMSLSSAWFKSGYPVVLHSHNVDCLYYITAGSIRMGTETLKPGDGFLVCAGVPYSFTAGPEGVEVLEFRTSESCDIRFSSNSDRYWDKALSTITERQPLWRSEVHPDRNRAGA